MKVVTLARGQLESLNKTSAYKVRYKKKFGPDGEESKTLSRDRPGR